MAEVVAKRVYIKTFGCQMNERDSRQMQLLLAREGYSSIDQPQGADLILFNTCTIREKAYTKAMSDIGRSLLLKQDHPQVRIGICGCAAQQSQENLLKRFPHIDFVVGPDQIGQLPELARRSAGSVPVVATDLIDDPGTYAFIDVVPEEDVASGTAFVTIMKGCNYNCTYCIVPTVRGREVCRPADEIIDEVHRLVARGVVEVTLLGQTVDAWKDPFGGKKSLTFGSLIRRIARETEIVRIRFTSPHPLHVDHDLIDTYRDEPKLCSHIHLPVQSGSNAVLRRMRRGYTRERYLELIERLRQTRPGLSVSTDIIVGFCGETEDDFAATLDLLDQIQFDAIFAFAYSPRPMTTAATDLHDDVPEMLKKKRLDALLVFQRKISRQKHESCVGKVEEVLVIGPDRQGSGRLTGRTDGNRIVSFIGESDRQGSVVPVRIVRARTHSLEGEMERERKQAYG